MNKSMVQDEIRARACNTYVLGGRNGASAVRSATEIGFIRVCNARGIEKGEEVLMAYGK